MTMLLNNMQNSMLNCIFELYYVLQGGAICFSDQSTPKSKESCQRKNRSLVTTQEGGWGLPTEMGTHPHIYSRLLYIVTLDCSFSIQTKVCCRKVRDRKFPLFCIFIILFRMLQELAISVGCQHTFTLGAHAQRGLR